MDFIYSRLNNNLIDINRLDTITLLKCEKDGSPVETLKAGDYYLKFTVVDSDKVSYCDLSDLNDDDKSLLDRIINDEKTFDQRIIDLGNDLNVKIDDLDKSLDERITKDEEYFGERCLYKSTTNASKWESKEGSFTGYLGNQSETTIKAKVGFNIENNISYLPSYPTVTGTYYAFNNQDNALTGKLNLTPINSNASPLFTFTGSGALSMGQRNIYLASDWFKQSTDNINLCLPAKSGTLITENDAMGCLSILVNDLETEKVELTSGQLNYLSKYPKSIFALHKQYSNWSEGEDDGNYRYFYKINQSIPFVTSGSVDYTFMTIVSGTRIGIASLKRTSDTDYLIIQYYNNASKEELEKTQTLLNQEISDRKTAIEAEQKERKDADEILQTNIDNEATVRDDADWELQQNIDTEQSRAQREENDIRANLSEEITTRETEVKELQEECSNITSGIQEFSNVINNQFQEKELEITKNADNITKITSAVNDYIDQTDTHLETLDSTTNSLQTNLTALFNKETGDVLDIQSSVAKEIKDRENADATLQSDIETEAATRETKDTNLQSQIDAITSSSDVVDVVETHVELEKYDYSSLTKNDIVKVLVDEKNNNKTSYYRYVTNLEEGSFPFILIGSVGPYSTISDTDSKIAVETARAEAAEDTLTTDLNNEVTRAKAAEEVNSTNITTEINRATEKENSIITDLNNETTRATAKETEMESELSTETVRAKGAEQTLDTKIDDLNETLTANINQCLTESKDYTDQLSENMWNWAQNEQSTRQDADNIITENIDSLVKKANNKFDDIDNEFNNLNDELIKIIKLDTNGWDYSGSLTDEQYNLIFNNKAVVVVRFAGEDADYIYAFSNFMRQYIDGEYLIYQYSINDLNAEDSERNVVLYRLVIKPSDKTWRIDYYDLNMVSDIAGASGKITLDDNLQINKNILSIDTTKIATKSSVDDLSTRVTTIEQTIDAGADSTMAALVFEEI